MTYRPSDFCIIAAVNDDEVLDACLAASPDVVSGALSITAMRGASCMAGAYNAGLDHTEAPICLFAHQDVYLPEGWLDRAVKALNALETRHPEWMVAGPYGVERNGSHVGRVWDVNMRRELGTTGFGPTAVESLDELLLILKRMPDFRFDEELPNFHFYGTDLVQTAWSRDNSAWAIELPVVHNNRPWDSLGGGYVDGYNFVKRKWRHRLPFFTTICEVSHNPIPLWRVRWRRRKVNARPDKLLAHAPDVARQAGYE